jgi:hypothetical protein
MWICRSALCGEIRKNHPARRRLAEAGAYIQQKDAWLIAADVNAEHWKNKLLDGAEH